MKNKKLFAILTLVCFLFTLMPVVAFASDNVSVKITDIKGETVEGNTAAVGAEFDLEISGYDDYEVWYEITFDRVVYIPSNNTDTFGYTATIDGKLVTNMITSNDSVLQNSDPVSINTGYETTTASALAIDLTCAVFDNSERTEFSTKPDGIPEGTRVAIRLLLKKDGVADVVVAHYTQMVGEAPTVTVKDETIEGYAFAQTYTLSPIVEYQGFFYDLGSKDEVTIDNAFGAGTYAAAVAAYEEDEAEALAMCGSKEMFLAMCYTENIEDPYDLTSIMGEESVNAFLSNMMEMQNSYMQYWNVDIVLSASGISDEIIVYGGMNGVLDEEMQVPITSGEETHLLFDETGIEDGIMYGADNDTNLNAGYISGAANLSDFMKMMAGLTFAVKELPEGADLEVEFVLRPTDPDRYSNWGNSERNGSFSNGGLNGTGVTWNCDLEYLVKYGNENYKQTIQNNISKGFLNAASSPYAEGNVYYSADPTELKGPFDYLDLYTDENGSYLVYLDMIEASEDTGSDDNTGAGDNTGSDNDAGDDENAGTGDNTGSDENTGSGDSTESESPAIEVELNEEITVPKAFEKDETLNTVEKIKQKLKDKIAEDDDFSAENTATFDAQLPSGEEFSSDGRLHVKVPYPAGTDKHKHNFRVVHMFTTDAFGKVPGDVEVIDDLTEEEDGLSFYVNGLSPIAIGWTEDTLPTYDSHVLSVDELNTFFVDSEYAALYNLLKDKENRVFGMNFGATESYDDAVGKLYADYNADFTVTADKDIAVLLLGNYGEYGTIGFITELKANEPYRVIADSTIGEQYGKQPYKGVVRYVHDFDCVAIPITDEVKAVYDGAADYSSATDDVTLALALNLYKTEPFGTTTKETGDSWIIGEAQTFAYSLPKKATVSYGGGGSYTSTSVSVASVGNATVKVSDKYASKGETVTITVDAKDGYYPAEVTVTDKNGEAVTVTRVALDKWEFTMPSGKVKVNVDTAECSKEVILQIGDIDVAVNDTVIQSDVASFIKNDRTMVPISVIVYALGGTTDWDGETRTVTVTLDGKVLTMVIDEIIPGFGAAAIIADSRTYVPIGYVADVLGCDVEWIAATRQVVIVK